MSENICPAGKDVCKEIDSYPRSRCYLHGRQLQFPHHTDNAGTPCGEGCKAQEKPEPISGICPTCSGNIDEIVESQVKSVMEAAQVDGLEKPGPVGEGKIPLDAEALAKLAELTGWEDVGRAALKTVGHQDDIIRALKAGNQSLQKTNEELGPAYHDWRTRAEKAEAERDELSAQVRRLVEKLRNPNNIKGYPYCGHCGMLLEGLGASGEHYDWCPLSTLEQS